MKRESFVLLMNLLNSVSEYLNKLLNSSLQLLINSINQMNIQIPFDSEVMNQKITDLQDILEKIFRGSAKEVSFQHSYRLLFELYKNQFGKTIQDVTESKMKEIFDRHLRQYLPEKPTLEEIVKKLNPLFDNIDIMMRVYQYVQTNYYLAEKKKSLKVIALETLKTALISHQKLFATFIAQTIELCIDVKFKQNFENPLLKNVVEIIFKLDCSDLSLFEKCFQEEYLRELETSNIKQIQLFKKGTIVEYLNMFVHIYNLETKFLNEYVKNRISEECKNAILKSHFNVWIAENKKYLLEREDTIKSLLSSDPNLVFNVYKLDEKAFNDFSEWYISLLKLKLSKLDTRDNNNLIKTFTNLYKKTIAQSQLAFKSKMAFEFWLNREELNIVNRLNFYISEYITGSTSNKENMSDNMESTLDQILIIFKLIKDKDMFEKGYRKMLIQRFITKRDVSKLQMELVQLMEKECGDCWGKKIQGLITQYTENLSIKHSYKIFSEMNWPYDHEHLEIRFAPQLVIHKQKFQNQYCKNNPTKLLRWHPHFGNGVIKVRFQKSSKLLVVSTPMMNILLHLNQRSSFTLQEFMKSSNYRFQDIRKQIYSLYKYNVINLMQNTNIKKSKLINEEEVPLLSKKDNTEAQIKTNMIVSLNFSFDFKGQELLINNVCEENKLEIVKKEELGMDRKLMVQSIIIKIIKQKKKIMRDNLFESIYVSVQKKGFSPNEYFIDGCFKDLIARDYIKDFEDGTFGYLA